MSLTFIPVGTTPLPAAAADRPARLRIVHIVRSPIGGIFRHIVDLADAQAAGGHAVGIVCDSTTGGPFEDEIIAKTALRLELGAVRLPMRRSISLADVAAVRRVLAHLSRLDPDVIHCHGAKGGVYGRLIAGWLRRRRRIACIYAPHGGTLHFDAASLEGRFYFRTERALERLTDALVHVSAYEAETYRRKVGIPRCRAVVIRNGLRDEEFVPVRAREDACDLLCLGMLRDLKGTDILLEAVAHVERVYGRKLTLRLAGQAEDLERYRSLARTLGIADRVFFSGPVPARQAFAAARVVVVPSRAESMPYVVMEAMAAGMPVIATRVGGIPEIFGATADQLVPPGDAAALARSLEDAFADPERIRAGLAARCRGLRDRFHISIMQNAIAELYDACLPRRLSA